MHARVAVAAGLLLLGLLVVPSPAHSIPLSNATFVDARGPHDATFSWSGACNGPVHLTLVVDTPTGSDTREADGTSIMVPDLCGIACLDCPYPFVWVIETEGLLAGGGEVLGPLWGLQGPFQDGFLQVRGTPLL